MTRSRRRIIAWLGILGIAFAQLAVTAHACMLRTAAPGSPASAAVVAHDGHCAGHQDAGAPLAPQGNACEVQCTDGAPTAAAPDLPPVTLSSLSVPLAPVAAPVDAREWDRSVLAAYGGAPPIALQFCRLLI